MKRVLALLVLFIGLTSCESHWYVVEQRVTEVTHNDLYLATYLWERGFWDHDIIWSSLDPWNQPNIDSIKCARYNQAVSMAKEIKRVNQLKCEQLKLTPDYATAVSTIIEKSMSQSGEYITTTADSVDQLKTAMTNLKLEAGDVFTDILAKPLSEAAESLTEVIRGVSDLRKQLDLGGANKDLANMVRGNIAAASGTAGGYFMRLLFGGNDLGKGELLIPAAKPIIKPTSTPKPKPSSGGGEDLIFGEGYWQRQAEAAAEWNEFADKQQRKYDLIDISGKSIASTTLSQIDNMNYLVQATEQWQYDWEHIAQMLDSTLSCWLTEVYKHIKQSKYS